MNELMTWTTQHPQQELLISEQKCLRPLLEELRGYHLLLCGIHRDLTWLPAHCLHALSLSPLTTSNTESIIQSYFDDLPLRDNSIDAVIVPYLLEYIDTPEALIKELFRCLINEGKLFLFGFERWHPWCWWNAPTCKKVLPLRKIKNILENAEFTIETINRLHYGAVYLIQAQKRMHYVTPLKPNWQTPEIADKLIQPTAQRAK